MVGNALLLPLGGRGSHHPPTIGSILGRVVGTSRYRSIGPPSFSFGLPQCLPGLPKPLSRCSSGVAGLPFPRISSVSGAQSGSERRAERRGAPHQLATLVGRATEH